MKVDKQILDVTSNLQGERIDMTIAADALVHIMGVLTNLYSDPVMAVLREYSTNAWDSHVEANQTRPIEITLPSNLAPNLVIRDYGVGLDVEDIRNIYSQYGTSTKRNSNSVVGMLGLGCKSALTYSNQFTVVGFKNGIMTSVSVSLDEEGKGVMTIPDISPTTQTNGATIIIPAKAQNDFKAKSDELFRFWPEGSVLVNGMPPKRIDGLWISKDILLTTEVRGPMIVMGNVPYPRNETQPANNYRYQTNNVYHVVAFVDIGTIAFAPSREALMFTPKTNGVLKSIDGRIENEKTAKFVEMMNKATTPWDAIKIYSSLKKFGFAEKDAIWNGAPISTTVSYPQATKSISFANGRDFIPKINFLSLNNLNSVFSKYDYSTHTSILLTQDKIVFVENYPSEHFTRHKKDKLRQWASKKGVDDANRVVFCDKLPDRTWINPDLIFDWAEIDAEKIVKTPSTTTNTGRPTGSYDGLVEGRSINLVAANIDVTKPLFYFHGNTWRRPKGYNVVLQEFPKATYIALPAGRIAKFKRDFPMAKDVEEYVKEIAVKWKNDLTEAEKLALKVKSVHRSAIYFYLDAAKFKDPDLKATIVAAKFDTTKLQEKANLYSNFGVKIEHDWKDPIQTKYLLLQNVGNYNVTDAMKKHIYIYANACYDAAKKEV